MPAPNSSHGGPNAQASPEAAPSRESVSSSRRAPATARRLPDPRVRVAHRLYARSGSTWASRARIASCVRPFEATRPRSQTNDSPR